MKRASRRQYLSHSQNGINMTTMKSHLIECHSLHAMLLVAQTLYHRKHTKPLTSAGG